MTEASSIEDALIQASNVISRLGSKPEYIVIHAGRMARILGRCTGRFGRVMERHSGRMARRWSERSGFVLVSDPFVGAWLPEFV